MTIHAAALFAGRVDDRGFMQAGFEGLMRARDELDFSVSYIDGIAPERDRLLDALRKLARSGAALVIAHGGQNNEAAQVAAAEFADTRFVVTQGNVVAPNLASYDVLQEQSAWLAGAAAGLLTRSDVVAHISGIRVVPGLKGRAAFAAGVKAANARATLLTTFCGTQDDTEVARRTANAQIQAGADILFTMLNAGMPGAIDACRAHGIKQIGNVRDWVKVAPDVFVGSALADVGLALFHCCSDLKTGRWRGAVVRRLGLEDAQAVRLVLSADTPREVRESIEKFRAAIIGGEISIPETYEGPEFTPT